MPTVPIIEQMVDPVQAKLRARPTSPAIAIDNIATVATLAG
jgi:hypothetical protein